MTGAFILLAATALGFTIVVVVRSLQRRSGKIAEYPTELRRFELAADGVVEYTQWLHPKESEKAIIQTDVDALRSFVNPGDLVIDIGAHTGDTSVPLALAAGKDGLTLALEPNPYVFAVLEKNARLNVDKTNIEPLNFAATDTDGTFTFHYSDGGFCNGGFLSTIRDQGHGHRQPLEVQGRNLENFLRTEHPERLASLRYIKIDTEGYDIHIIRSIMGIIEEFHPTIVCEVLHRLDQAERETLFDVLEAAGYACFKTVAERPHRGDPITRNTMMNWKQFDILAVHETRE